MKALYTIALWMFTALATAGETVWIDVRTAQEFNAGHKEGAVNIPFDEIAQRIGKLALESDTDIKLYCRSGARAGVAQATLESMGYSEVENVGSLGAALNYQGAAE
ncbi:MAG: MerR family transcriptional regulator [Oceanospirillaceae bacterium]|uniref:rhodanese-like domain-containing protein n=1 Tax=unclassified Thalassolituus TaxID=2624967 RepID=UPI000C46E65F|nr:MULTISPECIES: rhodanese-like domain-containing protein [unclassified Thalassolituus]MAX99779.1 MerR family transcriptional regulator [Oceanospirillaceae bacterium]MBL34589.1 MerR family transcriptional regulator [Oceanospirillaceae bacterium]MBS54947.1 MerR family transcriptional regulator [Oceanospirillaceae bacterium]|tara:strand:- start:335 stop:652 length:318 start_codon:yes stop_codon:yes gene_type:complete